MDMCWWRTDMDKPNPKRRRKGRGVPERIKRKVVLSGTKVPEGKAIHESRKKSRAQRKARRKNRG